MGFSPPGRFVRFVLQCLTWGPLRRRPQRLQDRCRRIYHSLPVQGLVAVLILAVRPLPSHSTSSQHATLSASAGPAPRPHSPYHHPRLSARVRLSESARVRASPVRVGELWAYGSTV